MKCPFRYRRREPARTEFSFGVAEDFVDFVEKCDEEFRERERDREAAFNAAHPTCWKKFLHRIGRR